MPINKQEELESNLGKIVDKYLVPRTIKKRELFALRWGMFGELKTYYKNVMAQSNEWWNQKLANTKEEAKQSGIEEERKRMAQKLLDMETVQEILDYCDEIIYPESYKKD